MITTSETLIPIGATALNLPNTTDTGGALDKAGADFGSLLLNVGNSVADTQLKLTENSANTTSELASKLVDVIAVQQNIYDDDGSLRPGTQPIMQKMSVLNFVSPVWYEVPQVRLQGCFMVNEFVTASDTSVNSSSSGFGFGVGMSLQKKAFAFGASGGFGSSSDSTRVSTTSDQASAVGQMRMNARLSPREDVGIPKPLRVLNGPSITISTEALEEEKDTDGNITSRSLSILIFLRRSDGTAIDNKELSIDTEGIPFEFVPAQQTATDDDGRLEIRLSRSFPKALPDAPPTDTAPKQSLVTAILGVVSNRTTITL